NRRLAIPGCRCDQHPVVGEASLSSAALPAWHKTRALSPLYDDLQTLGNASPAQPMVRGVLYHLSLMHTGKRNTGRLTRTTTAACSGEYNPKCYPRNARQYV